MGFITVEPKPLPFTDGGILHMRLTFEQWVSRMLIDLGRILDILVRVLTLLRPNKLNVNINVQIR